MVGEYRNRIATWFDKITMSGAPRNDKWVRMSDGDTGVAASRSKQMVWIGRL
jgi:hypothetical protein